MSRILVIAQEWTPRALIRAQLEEEGHDATGCLTLDEGLLLLHTRRPPFDAVVFDTRGQEFTPRALERLAAAGPPVVVLTGPLDPAAAELAKHRFARVLVRPAFVGDVVRAVGEVVGGAG